MPDSVPSNSGILPDIAAAALLFHSKIEVLRFLIRPSDLIDVGWSSDDGESGTPCWRGARNVGFLLGWR